MACGCEVSGWHELRHTWLRCSISQLRNARAASYAAQRIAGTGYGKLHIQVQEHHVAKHVFEDLGGTLVESRTACKRIHKSA